MKSIDDSTGGEQSMNEKMTVRPKWYLSGHTMKWILANVLTFGMVTMFTLGASLIPIILAFVRRGRTEYTLSGGRLHIKKVRGLLGKEQTKQIPVRDITDISTSASFFERKGGVGTVSFAEGDGAYSTITLSGIPRHKELAEEIGRRQNEQAKQTLYQT